jgi:hypothetical protein
MLSRVSSTSPANNAATMTPIGTAMVDDQLHIPVASRKPALIGSGISRSAVQYGSGAYRSKIKRAKHLHARECRGIIEPAWPIAPATMVFMPRIERVPVIQEVPEWRAAVLRLHRDPDVVEVAVRKHLQPV